MYPSLHPILTAAIVLAAAPALATTTVVMQFDEVSGNRTAFPDTIGDSAHVDVTNRTRAGFGAAAESFDALLYWANNYSELVDVAYPASNGRVGELQFDVAAGYEIVFDSFRYGNYFNGGTPRDSIFRIYDGAWNTIFEETVTGHTGNSVEVQPGVSGGMVGAPSTYYFQWGTDWNIGIDDFTYTSQSVTGAPDAAVPLPAGLPLLAGALAAIAMAQRARRDG